jgi:hypothetical protein
MLRQARKAIESLLRISMRRCAREGGALIGAGERRQSSLITCIGLNRFPGGWRYCRPDRAIPHPLLQGLRAADRHRSLPASNPYCTTVTASKVRDPTVRLSSAPGTLSLSLSLPLPVAPSTWG